MRDYTTQPPTYSEYETYPQVWKPKETGDQGLFLVRVPPDLQEMTDEIYLQLMQLRVQWMICHWITETNEPQETTARRLAQALSKLSSQQTPPALHTPGTGELSPIDLWTEEWSETLVRYNETLTTKFELQNSWVFPMSVQLPSDPAIQKDWQSEHDDEITLEIWLSYLTAEMS
mgnify:FL=1